MVSLDVSCDPGGSHLSLTPDGTFSDAGPPRTHGCPGDLDEDVTRWMVCRDPATGPAFRKQHYTGLNHFWCLKTWEKNYDFSLKKFNIQNAVEDFVLMRTNPGQQKVQHAGASFSPCLLTAGSWWGVTACSCLHGGLVTLAVLWWNLWWESKVGELLKIAACVAFGWSCPARSW